jgi:hypothetical protein
MESQGKVWKDNARSSSRSRYRYRYRYRHRSWDRSTSRKGRERQGITRHGKERHSKKCKEGHGKERKGEARYGKVRDRPYFRLSLGGVHTYGHSSRPSGSLLILMVSINFSFSK